MNRPRSLVSKFNISHYLVVAFSEERIKEIEEFTKCKVTVISDKLLTFEHPHTRTVTHESGLMEDIKGFKKAQLKEGDYITKAGHYEADGRIITFGKDFFEMMCVDVTELL